MRGYYHVNERGAIVLCKQQNAALRRGCMLTQWVLPCSICGDVRSLCSRICPRLSAPPWKGGVRSWADVLSCRFDGERNADIQSAWAHHLSPEGPPLIRGQTDYLKKCHTHLNAAEEQPWGLPSNERTLTVSCNILSHNLGSARWRKRFWRIVAGAAFILPLELVIFACFATIGQSLTGVSQ